MLNITLNNKKQRQTCIAMHLIAFFMQLNHQLPAFYAFYRIYNKYVNYRTYFLDTKKPP